MIYCVRFDDVVAHLTGLGFTAAGRTASTFLYQRGEDEFTIRIPNQNGDLPEAIINDALDSAGLPVPRWTVHWCD